MDRRSFFRSMIGGVVATAAVRSWPFRVFSFPSEIVSGYDLTKFATIYYSKEALDALRKNIKFEYAFPTFPLRAQGNPIFLY